MSTIYRYAPRALLAEALQGGLVFALTAGLLYFARPAGLVAWGLAAAAGLFLVYFVRAIVRSRSQIEVDARGIQTRGPLGVAISWEELRALRLHHYTTRSDRSGGWMQLVVRGAHATIRVDSGLEKFAQLAAVLHVRARQLGHPLDERTRFNLRSLGIAGDD